MTNLPGDEEPDSLIDSMNEPFAFQEGDDSLTLRELLARNIDRGVRTAQSHPRMLIGTQWWQFTWAEAEVFHIDAVAWPRLILTLDCFDAVRRTSPTRMWPRHLLERAVSEEPWLRDLTPGREDFLEFAWRWSGLKNRDAVWVYELDRIRWLGDEHFPDDLV